MGLSSWGFESPLRHQIFFQFNTDSLSYARCAAYFLITERYRDGYKGNDEYKQRKSSQQHSASSEWFIFKQRARMIEAYAPSNDQKQYGKEEIGRSSPVSTGSTISEKARPAMENCRWRERPKMA